MSYNQVIIFKLNGVRYGIDILQVQEIMRMVEITPVAEADPNIEGIVNLRGQVIKVINLSRLLGMPEKETDENTRVIVVENGGGKTGLIVDEVVEVGTYTDEEKEEPRLIGMDLAFLKEIVKKKDNILLVLDMSRII